jgi:hypothetical protein
MGLFAPDWLTRIPPNLRPDGHKVKELEKLRRDFQIPHDVFAGMVVQSPATMKMTFEQAYLDLRKKYPQAKPKQIIAGVYQLRVISNRHAMLFQMGVQPSAPVGAQAARQAAWNSQIENAMREAENIVRHPEDYPRSSEYYLNQDMQTTDEVKAAYERDFSEAIKGSNSIEDLVRWFVTKEQYYERTPDPFRIRNQIDAILGWDG